MPKRFRSNIQNRKLFGIASKLKLSHDDLREMTFDLTDGRTDHTSQLYTDECDKLIKWLEDKLPKKTQQPSRRTVNYRKQKAGVETIATSTHIDYMNSLRRKREMSEAGLGDLSARVNKGVRIPRTSKEVNRVIEAIKKMNERDRTFNGFSKREEKEAA